MAASSTWCCWQKAPSWAIPSGWLGKTACVPPGRMQACRVRELTSTPQMIRATVTFLVSATERHATVRSCVTWAAVTWAERRSLRPQDEREPSARGGTDASVPPPRHLRIKMPLFQRYKDDIGGGVGTEG